MHEKSVFKIDFESMKNKYIDSENEDSYSARTLHMTLKNIFEIFDSSTMFSSTAKKMSLGRFYNLSSIFQKNQNFLLDCQKLFKNVKNYSYIVKISTKIVKFIQILSNLLKK
jgi:hypothetical protein